MYKRNCAKSRKKLGGVYLLGGSHRAVGEHSICSRGSMQASTPTNINKIHHQNIKNRPARLGAGR